MKKLIVICSILFLMAVPLSAEETYDTSDQRDTGGGNHNHHVGVPVIEEESPVYIGQEVDMEFKQQQFCGIDYTPSFCTSFFYEMNNDNTKEYRAWGKVVIPIGK